MADGAPREGLQDAMAMHAIDYIIPCKRKHTSCNVSESMQIRFVSETMQREPILRLHTARDLGALVRDRRRARGWDQQKLADKIGSSRLWVSEMENGKPTVQLDLVLRTLDALEIRLRADDATATRVESRAAQAIDQMLRKK